MEMENWPRDELERAIRWWQAILNGRDERVHLTILLVGRLGELIRDAQGVLERRDAGRCVRKVTRKA